VLIGVPATGIFGMVGIVTASFNRTLNTAVNGLRESMSVPPRGGMMLDR